MFYISHKFEVKHSLPYILYLIYFPYLLFSILYLTFLKLVVRFDYISTTLKKLYREISFDYYN